MCITFHAEHDIRTGPEKFEIKPIWTLNGYTVNISMKAGNPVTLAQDNCTVKNVKSKCLLGETRVCLAGHMVLWCNALTLKNHFKMFLLDVKKGNIHNVMSRTLFCCHYLENLAVYQRFLVIKMFLLLF